MLKLNEAFGLPLGNVYIYIMCMYGVDVLCIFIMWNSDHFLIAGVQQDFNLSCSFSLKGGFIGALHRRGFTGLS